MYDNHQAVTDSAHRKPRPSQLLAICPCLIITVLVAACSINVRAQELQSASVIRKISGGSRSDEGTKTRLGLASLFETWQARRLNPFDECLKLLSQQPSSPA